MSLDQNSFNNQTMAYEYEDGFRRDLIQNENSVNTQYEYPCSVLVSLQYLMTSAGSNRSVKWTLKEIL